MQHFNKSFNLLLTAIFILLMSQIACAQETIEIYPNTVIAYPRTYENVTLDLSKGSFIIKNNATLTIKNSNINGTLSKNNPTLITVETGKLVIDNSQANINTKDLTPHPLTQSLQHVIYVGLGEVTLKDSSFKIDQAFTAGLLITTSTIPSSHFKIVNNKFDRFHGVLYLIASDDSLITDNVFDKNSYGHVVLIGNRSQILRNTIYYSGNDHLGNSMDIIDSSHIVISDNRLYTPTCHGIYILNSHDVVIDNNRISGGITYAMNVLSYPEKIEAKCDYLTQMLASYKMRNNFSNNIVITNNYMSQNRYGVAVSDTDTVNISNNIFIQRFSDAEARKFWTNNQILLQNVTHLTWQDNLYKEAYTQEMNGSNKHSKHLVPFPVTGGVVFN